MKYELDRLGSDGFERMVQALVSADFGIDCKIYGDGPDGQREAVIGFPEGREKRGIFNGGDVYGQTVVQAKFKSPDGKDGDWTWLRGNLKSELDGFRKKKQTRPELVPDTYLFFTNIILTSALDSGVRDKADNFAEQYRDLIPNIRIFGADDIRAMLDRHRDIAAGYSSFIMPGDVLSELYTYFRTASNRPFEALVEYARRMIIEDSAVRLEQAGSVTDRSINIHNVYTDLEAVSRSGQDKSVDGIAKYVVELGNAPHRRETPTFIPEPFREYRAPRENIVLIGGAGQGKSTICQYICQIYRAAMLKRFKPNMPNLTEYMADSDVPAPNCERYPIRIALKDYAGWLARRGEEDSRSVLHYVLSRITRKTEMNLEMPDFRKLLSSYSWIFMFDGLDEVPASSNRAAVLGEIQSFLTYDLPAENCDCLIICTSRPQGYDNAFDGRMYNHFELCGMSEPLCKKYLKRLLNHIEDNGDQREQYYGTLCAALKDPMVSKLMTTPLYASIVAILVKSGGTPPTRRYELFSDYCTVAVKREQQKGTLPKLDDCYNWIMPLHREIAYILQLESENQENAAAEMDDRRCTDIIIGYLRTEEYNGDERDMAGKLYSAVVNRLPFIAEVPGDGGECHVSFPLRSIQEYFAAEKLINTEENKLASILELISLNSYWRNVYLFVAGYFMSHPDRKNINDQLLRICERNNGDEELEHACAHRAALSGSILALDLLGDNIIRKPSVQNKYLALADKLLERETESYFTDKFLRLPAAVLDRYIDGKLEEFIRGNGCRGCGALDVLTALARTNKKAAKVLIKLMPELRDVGLSAVMNMDGIEDGVIDPGDADAYFIHFPVDRRYNRAVFGSDSTFIKGFIANRAYISKETAGAVIRNVIAVFLNPFFRYDADLLKRIFGDKLVEALERVRVQMSMCYGSMNGIGFRAVNTDNQKAEDTSYKQVYNYLCSNGMAELAYCIRFFYEPCYESFKAFVEEWCKTDTGFRELLRPLLRKNWLLCDDDGLLYSENRAEKILEKYSPEYCRRRLDTVKRIADLAAAADFGGITEKGFWGNSAWIMWQDSTEINKEALAIIVNALRSADCTTLDYGVVKAIADLLYGCNTIPRELVDFCAENNLRLNESEWSNTLYSNILFVSVHALPADFTFSPIVSPYYYYLHENVLPLFAAIDEYVSAENGYHSALALILVGMNYLSFSPELLPAVGFDTYQKARASGHRGARFGCLLALMCGDIPTELRETVKDDAARFLSDDNCVRYFFDCTNHFSLDAKELLYEAALCSDFPHRRELMSRLERSIHEQLSSLPSRPEELTRRRGSPS